MRRAQEPNKPDDIAWSVELLHLAHNAGRKVLVVEYLKDRETIFYSVLCRPSSVI